jgi:penicillin V acylase-like amidase (Ntn superfamily)
MLALVMHQNKNKACSMYKITVDGKTMVGCNHDAWLTTPKIWFENAKQYNEYGTVFTGSRQVSPNRTTPQSGMNTTGLVFSRLSSFYPKQNKRFEDRRKISNEADYLSGILHRCATVKEVKKYIQQFDHSFFLNDVFIYIDSSGDYLIVEPYNFIEGKNPNYVLANFCPSITSDKQARKLERYRNGSDFLKRHKAISSIDFSTALSDTMSV